MYRISRIKVACIKYPVFDIKKYKNTKYHPPKHHQTPQNTQKKHQKQIKKHQKNILEHPQNTQKPPPKNAQKRSKTPNNALKHPINRNTQKHPKHSKSL